MTPTFDELLQDKNYVHITHKEFRPDWWADWFYNAADDKLFMFREETELYNYGGHDSMQNIFFDGGNIDLTLRYVKQISPRVFRFSHRNNEYTPFYLDCLRLFLKSSNINAEIAYVNKGDYLKIVFKNTDDVNFFLLKHGTIIK